MPKGYSATTVKSLTELYVVGEGLEFTEASEFARSIQLREPEDSAKPSDSTSHMGVDDNVPAAPQPKAAPPKQRKSSSK